MPIFPARPVPDLIPNGGLTCLCRHCQKEFIVTEWRDFTHRPQFIDTDTKKQDALYIPCPLCNRYAATPQNMAEHIITYELWKLSRKPKPTWAKTIYCPECKVSSVITIDNIVVIDTSGSEDGWGPQVSIKCPLCFSHTPAEERIPSGVSKFAIATEQERQNK